MRKFAQGYPDALFVQEVLAQLIWYHVLILFLARPLSVNQF